VLGAGWLWAGFEQYNSNGVLVGLVAGLFLSLAAWGR
jgi:hypothetical protein